MGRDSYPFRNTKYKTNTSSYNWFNKINNQIKIAQATLSATSRTAHSNNPEEDNRPWRFVKPFEQPEQFANRKCFPPIVAIRRQKVWLYKIYCFFSKKQCANCVSEIKLKPFDPKDEGQVIYVKNNNPAAPVLKIVTKKAVYQPVITEDAIKIALIAYKSGMDAHETPETLQAINDELRKEFGVYVRYKPFNRTLNVYNLSDKRVKEIPKETFDIWVNR